MADDNFRFGTYLLPQGTGVPIYFDCVISEIVTRQIEVTQHPVEVGANVADHARPKLIGVKLEAHVSQEPLEPLIHPEGKGLFGAMTLTFPSYPAAAMAARSTSVGMPPYPLNPLSVAATALVNPGGLAIRSLGPDDRGSSITVNSYPGNQDFTNKNVNALQWQTPFDSLANLLTVLDFLRDQSGLIDVVTRSKYYANFILTEVQTKRDKDTGTGTRISLDFTEMRFVQTSQVAAPATARPKDQPSVTRGRQEAVPAASAGESAPPVRRKSAGASGYDFIFG